MKETMGNPVIPSEATKERSGGISAGGIEGEIPPLRSFLAAVGMTVLGCSFLAAVGMTWGWCAPIIFSMAKN